MFAPNLLAQSDPELWNAIRLEHQRQEDHVELIASENYVSRQVLIAQGSQNAPLQNAAQELAVEIERVCELADHLERCAANVGELATAGG